MRSNRAVISFRARFAATVAAVIALVALGGVTAPAFADVNLTITVYDNSTGGVYANRDVSLGLVGGGWQAGYTTDAGGSFSASGLAEGDYFLTPIDATYTPTGAFSLNSGTTTQDVNIDQYKVQGTIPTGTGSGHTTVVIYYYDAIALDWVPATGSLAVSPTGDSFELRLPYGPGDYRLLFTPDATVDYLDTFSAPFTLDGSSGGYDLGAVSFESSPVIRGSVVSEFGAAVIAGATVTASVSGSDVASGTSDAFGDYRIKLPLGDEDYTVTATAPGYLTQEWDASTSGAETVPINGLDGYTHDNVDFVLETELVDVTGSVESSGAPYAVTSKLYKKDLSGLYDPTPVNTVQNVSDFDFLQLSEGDYRLALSRPSTGVTLPISGFDLNGAGFAPSSDPCFIEFTVDYGVGDLDFSDVAVDATASATACDDPVWADAGDGTISGSVLNYYNFGDLLLAQLWAGGTTTPSLVDVSVVVGGDYSFTGVRGSGEYFIKFLPSGNDAFLETLLGDGGYSEWSSGYDADSAFSDTHSFSVDPSTPGSYPNHDITIVQGAMLRGYLTSYGAPIVGCVIATNVADPTISICAPADEDSKWAVRVPVGGSYTLHATDYVGKYADEWWENAHSGADATPVGPVTAGVFGDYNFSLAPSPAALYGFVRDVADPNPITVHLYYKDGGGEWREAGVQDTTPGVDQVYFDDNYYGAYDGLFQGDYRMRFQDSTGKWLAATESLVGQLPDLSGTPTPGPSCFVDVPNILQGMPYFVDATFDTANQTASCGAEPLNFGDVTGHVITSATYASADVADHLATLYNDDYTESDDTDAGGVFTLTNVPNGDYALEVVPTSHIWGEHEYGYAQSSLTLTGGNVDLGTLVATRYGNAFGQISNWDDATMAGAVATVYHLVTDPAGDSWVPGPVDVPVSSSGEFEVPGIDATGSYGVMISFASTYAPVFLGGGFLAPDVPFAGIGEEDYDLGLLDVDLDNLVTISGTAFFGSSPLDGGIVLAHAVGSTNGIVFPGLVNPDGTYSIQVAPNVDYEVAATHLYLPLLVQIYNGHNYPFDYTGPYLADTVVVGTDDVGDINFSLVAVDEVYVDLYLASWDEATDGYDDFEDVDVHLYKYVVDGWEEVATPNSDPFAYVEAEGDGDYRLRFSKDGDWLAIHDVDYGRYYPYAPDDEEYDVLDPAECYYDFSEVQHGTYIWADISLIPDPAVGGCGPETLADHHEVAGSTVTTAAFGNVAIPNQTVTLTNESTLTTFSATTANDGTFAFEGVSPGTYTLSAPTMPVGPSGYTFAPATVTGIVVDGDEALDPLELTRYGNATVQITNWDAATMAGTTAQLYVKTTDGSGDHWNPVGLEATVDSGGSIVIPGIAEVGEYTAWIDYPAGFVDSYLTDSVSAENMLTFPGFAEDDAGVLDTVAYTTISGIVHLGVAAVPGANIEAQSFTSETYYATTASDGSYSVAIPAGAGVSVQATKAGLVRDIISTVSVAFAPVTGVNLELHYATFIIRVDSAVATPLPTATAHLYRQVTGGWQEVDSDTDAVTYLWTNLTGSYRIRISDGADWLAVSDYSWLNHADPADNSGGPVSPVPNVCYYDFAPATAGAEYDIELTAVAPTSGVECAAEPAVVAPPSTPGTSGHGRPHHLTPVTDEATADETAEPTATPTPSPEPSEPAADEPEAATPPADSGPDLTPAFWIAGVLAFLVLAGGATFLIRRRL